MLKITFPCDTKDETKVKDAGPELSQNEKMVWDNMRKVVRRKVRRNKWQSI